MSIDIEGRAKIGYGQQSGIEIKALRDKFAEAALPAELERAIRINSATAVSDLDPNWRRAVARRCYEMADAMIAARGGK